MVPAKNPLLIISEHIISSQEWTFLNYTWSFSWDPSVQGETLPPITLHRKVEENAKLCKASTKERPEGGFVKWHFSVCFSYNNNNFYMILIWLKSRFSLLHSYRSIHLPVTAIITHEKILWANGSHALYGHSWRLIPNLFLLGIVFFFSCHNTQM